MEVRWEVLDHRHPPRFAGRATLGQWDLRTKEKGMITMFKGKKERRKKKKLSLLHMLRLYLTTKMKPLFLYTVYDQRKYNFYGKLISSIIITYK